MSVDCLNEIFDHLEDKNTIHSCLLVNRLWCEVSIRILWKSIWNYHTLIACLPKESKEILDENNIIISTPTSNPPLFNYVTFIKRLSIDEIDKKFANILKNLQPRIILMKEIFKMFMNQISLKELENHQISSTYISDVTFISYPVAMDCLKYLLEFRCSSDIGSKFFFQLSQVCHN